MASWEPLVTTALIALASAVASLAVGYPLGYWLATLRRLRRVVTGVLLVPFLLPAFLVGLAIRPLLGDALASESLALIAIIGAHVVMNAGFLAIVTAASLTSRDQYEAALLDGKTLTFLWRRLWRGCKPSSRWGSSWLPGGRAPRPPFCLARVTRLRARHGGVVWSASG